MKKFDYKTIVCSAPSEINNILPELQKLGKQGWELVSVCPTSSSEYGIDLVTVFLKKEIE